MFRSTSFEQWIAAEYDMRFAQRQFMYAIQECASDSEQRLACKRDLADKREVAHALFVAAMRDAREDAQRLHYRNIVFPVHRK